MNDNSFAYCVNVVEKLLDKNAYTRLNLDSVDEELYLNDI